MKHLKQLAYNAIQFYGKQILILGLLFGGIATAAYPPLWYVHFPACLLGCLLAEMGSQHKKYKSSGKY